jgi:hypothetical protein
MTNLETRLEEDLPLCPPTSLPPPTIMTESVSHRLALGEAPRGARKPRVVVTGGSGKAGRSAVSHLASKGWEVIK